MTKPAILVFGKRCEYLGPGGYYRYPGGWLRQGSFGWTVFCHGVSACGTTPELAIRRLQMRALKVVEATE